MKRLENNFANAIQSYSRLENNATRREIKSDETKVMFRLQRRKSHLTSNESLVRVEGAVGLLQKRGKGCRRLRDLRKPYNVFFVVKQSFVARGISRLKISFINSRILWFFIKSSALIFFLDLNRIQEMYLISDYIIWVSSVKAKPPSNAAKEKQDQFVEAEFCVT